MARTLPVTLPVRVIKKHIDVQFDASRKIFRTVEELADFSEEEKIKSDPVLMSTLERIMEQLLDIGDEMSQEASSAGNEVLQLFKANEANG